MKNYILQFLITLIYKSLIIFENKLTHLKCKYAIIMQLQFICNRRIKDQCRNWFKTTTIILTNDKQNLFPIKYLILYAFPYLNLWQKLQVTNKIYGCLRVAIYSINVRKLFLFPISFSMLSNVKIYFYLLLFVTNYNSSLLSFIDVLCI